MTSKKKIKHPDTPLEAISKAAFEAFCKVGDTATLDLAGKADWSDLSPESQAAWATIASAATREFVKRYNQFKS